MVQNIIASLNCRNVDVQWNNFYLKKIMSSIKIEEKHKQFSLHKKIIFILFLFVQIIEHYHFGEEKEKEWKGKGICHELLWLH